ncbi:sulfotransferase domain-containing protein [Baaleninema simplex]|uniref:sulfotransferase domain-containing protein n=1 Tax=Baaleninema simplex TaxID=2862350 RepID=UPI0009FD728E|nr:sulfotransferase domain-containing protein [Baaleninema simplex]
MVTIPTWIDPMVKPLKAAVSQKIDQKIRAYTETVPISEFLPEDDVFIVGYPKSGNSWFQNLITGLVYGVNPAQAPDAIVQDLVPDIHYKRYYRRYSTPMFFKSHLPPQPTYRKVIYLLRDGRDVMVSYYRFLQALRSSKNESVDFLHMVKTGEGLFQNRKWHDQVEAWLKNPHQADTITVRYEDMLERPVDELERVCEFIHFEASRDVLEQVTAAASFQSLRKKEEKFGLNNPGWPKDKFFNRRGKAGSYKDEMPKEVLEAFMEEAGETLEKVGYEV